LLYLVATPIGNLEDISLRAIRVLREVSLIAAEDTRTTRRLLSHLQIATPLTSYFEHNKLTKLDSILATAAEKDVALVSEAGMPGISDPGYELVREAAKRGIRVVPIPGPSAFVLALAVSGLPTDRFVYLGFLPRRAAARRQTLNEVRGCRPTLVAYEAPHRLRECLEDALLVLGDRPAAVCRELTKLHEETVRGTLSELLSHFRAHEPRGEITIVIGGEPAPHTTEWDEQEVKRRLAEAEGRGLSPRDAVSLVAEELQLPRRLVYRLSVADKRTGRSE